MNEQTSSRVSGIAARLLHLSAGTLTSEVEKGNSHVINLAEDIRTLAASCLTQDETPGSDELAPWLSRLQKERAELHERTSKLAEFLGKGAPNVDDDEKSFMVRQHTYMANYFTVLNQRAVMHGLDPMTIPELTLGEDDGNGDLKIIEHGGANGDDDPTGS